MTPSVFEFILLGLAGWSTFHLLAHDDILDRPRRAILRLGADWRKEGDPVPDDYRVEWGLFLTCPYCAGFWIWIAWLIAWWIAPSVIIPAAVLMGGRAMIVFCQKVVGKAEDQAVSEDAAEVSAALRDIAKKAAVRGRS